MSKLNIMNLRRIKQSGFTITELLVGVTAGLMVVSGGIAIMVSILSSNSDVVKTSRLNMDLTAILAIMSSEIRRAGYNGDLADDDTFNTTDNVSLEIPDSHNCIHYAYANGNVALHYGFRHDSENKEVLMTTQPQDPDSFSCANGGGDWERLNDKKQILIPNLTITPDTACLDKDGLTLTCGDEDEYVRVRQVRLSITGQSTDDSTITSTVETVVRLRNDQPKGS